MRLLRLAPEIQERILCMPEMARRPVITERALRPIIHVADPEAQLAHFRALFAEVQ